MAKITKKRLLAYLALLTSSFIWSLAVPLAKKGFETNLLTPTLFLFTRFLVAAIFSLPIVLLFKKNRHSTKKILKSSKLPIIILLEFLGIVVSLGLLYLGVSLTSGIEASILSVVYPIFTIIGGVIFLKEKENRPELIGLALAVLGTLLLTSYPIFKGSFNGHLRGNIIILVSSLTMAIYYLLAKKQYQGINKWTTTHFSFWIGTICFGAIFFYYSKSPITELLALTTNFWAILPVIYMAIPGSVIALSLYLIGQDHIEASEASLFTYLHPVFSIPASVILLNESVTAFEIVALLIIFAGVYLAQKR